MSELSLPLYTVRRAAVRPCLDGEWDGPAWREVEPLTVAHYHPNSSDHHPFTQAKSVYDDKAIYGIFRVEDRYVLSTHLGYQSHVYRDACVEFFAKPKADKGHMNFEMNCGGHLLLQYIEDPTRTADGFVKYEWVSDEVGARVQLRGSMPDKVEPELEGPVVWTLEYAIPFAVFEAYVGPLGAIPGQTWRVNFNKCSVDNSHPHWGSWSSIGERFEFHQPERFGYLHFEA